MYQLPDDFDEKLLFGCYLEMVCFGPSVTKLEFSRTQMSSDEPYGVTFVVEGRISFVCDGNSGTRESNNPQSIALLLGLLMRDVDSLKRHGSAGLEILFKPEGYILLDADESPNFEAYSIYLSNGDTITV